MNCEFCNKTFSSKGNLQVHQKKTKSCLDIQNKSPEKKYNCLYCSKTFILKDTHDRHLVTHITDPIFIKLQKTEEEIKKLKDSIENKELELKNKEIELKNKEIELKNKDEQIKVFQDLNEKLLMRAVSTPKNTYNTVNIENITPMTKQHLDDNVKNLTIDHINKGCRGYAEYMINYPCKNSLVVTDIARCIFKYKDENGNLCVDVEARNLINKITKSIDPHNRDLITKAISEINSNKRIDVLEQLKRIAELAEYSNSIGSMDGMSSEFAKKLCKELVNLAPKKNSLHTNDNRDSLIKSDDIEYIMSYSDSETEIVY